MSFSPISGTFTHLLYRRPQIITELRCYYSDNLTTERPPSPNAILTAPIPRTQARGLRIPRFCSPEKTLRESTKLSLDKKRTQSDEPPLWPVLWERSK